MIFKVTWLTLAWGTLVRPSAKLYFRLWRWEPEPESVSRFIRGCAFLIVYFIYSSVYINFAAYINNQNDFNNGRVAEPKLADAQDLKNGKGYNPNLN